MPFDAASYIMGKNASGGGGSAITVEPLTVTENDTYTAPDGKAYTPVTVNVPNTYSASDEGKVVDNGELVAQTSLTVTQNGTVDTTLNNEVVVNVPTGGGGVASNDVNFLDYDGTIVASYSAADFANLTALPDNPSHSGLTAQGWNWTLADAKEYVASYGFLDIGQMYITDDGKTRLYIELDDIGRNNVQITVGQSKASGIYIDWDDGSQVEQSGGNASTIVTLSHTYTSIGRYCVKLWPIEDGTLQFGTDSNSRNVMGSTASQPYVYGYMLKAIEFGLNATLYRAYGFEYCANLEYVTMPQSMTTLRNYTFAYCISLKSFTVPAGTANIPSSSFNGCNLLKRLSLPKSITGIYSSSFGNCWLLYRQPCIDKVTDVGDSSFSSTRCIQNFVVPSGVESIGKQAFNGCTALVSIKFKPTTPPTVSNSNAFSGLPTDCIIYVPFASLASYLSATNYPSTATYTYLGFATYASGATLPTQDTTSAYNVSWYATKEDAKAGTNPITQGNGSEVYCTYAAV